MSCGCSTPQGTPPLSVSDGVGKRPSSTINWTLVNHHTPLAILKNATPDSVKNENGSVTIDGNVIYAGMQTTVGASMHSENSMNTCRSTTSTTRFMPMYAHFNSMYTPAGGVIVTRSRKDGD